VDKNELSDDYKKGYAEAEKRAKVLVEALTAMIAQGECYCDGKHQCGHCGAEMALDSYRNSDKGEI
jgi:hypothetical protein